MKINFVVVLVISSLILIPSLALVSFSQSNQTSSDDVFIDEELSANQSSFSDWSRKLAQNQSESDSDDESDDEDDE